MAAALAALLLAEALELSRNTQSGARGAERVKADFVARAGL